MADQAISSLALAEAINNADLFVLEQSGVAKKLTGATLTQFINRNLVNVSVHALASTSTPTADFDRITGTLSLGIPNGNSIVSAQVDNNANLILTWADGTTVVCGTVKGDTGKSAYDYAVENGYEGSETDFATLQVNLYQASLNEAERVQAEQDRQEGYTYMMERVQDKLDELGDLVDQNELVIVGTTLMLYRESVSVVGTTIVL